MTTTFDITSKPDMDNYYDRITEIQEAIASDTFGIKNPKAAPMDVNYWLLHAGGQTNQRETAHVVYVTFSVRFILVRQKGGGALGDFASEAQLVSDMTEVLWNFESIPEYRNFKTTAYPTIQVGFAPDSAVITNQQRFEGTTANGVVIGSIHTLSWGHRMVNAPA